MAGVVMRRFLIGKSKRHGFDGWAVRIRNASLLDHTVCTTREEARAERDALLKYGPHYEVVKVRVNVEVVE